MLAIYTLAEALTELTKQTGRAWSESEFYDAVLRLGINLHAAPPRTATVTLWEFVLGEGMVARHRGLPWEIGIVYPASIAELWQTGEAETIYADGGRGPSEHQYRWFADPVLVRSDNVRIKREPLSKLIDFVKSKAGDAEPPPDARPLLKRERDVLLSIIAVLCKEAKLDAAKHAKTAGLIASTAASMGVNIGESTIEGHLKKIPDALAGRMK